MPNPVHFPAGFAPVEAVGFAAPDGSAIVASIAQPLPVAVSRNTAAPPVSGTTTTSATSPPYAARADLPLSVALSGSWAGSVAVQRSPDAGASWLPLTVGGQPWGVFSANAYEDVAVPGDDTSLFRLAMTIASGSLTYRIAQ